MSSLTLGTGGSPGWSAEEAWLSMPVGGETVFQSRPKVDACRLEVAQVQEMLSQVNSSLSAALEDHLRPSPRVVGTSVPSLQRELNALDGELAELEIEEATLQSQLANLRTELTQARRAAELRRSGAENSTESDSMADGDVLAVFSLLACMKDVARAQRARLIPNDPDARTFEQNAVVSFLDEVEACQAETAGCRIAS